MIRENVTRILNELPAGVELVAAAKSRTPEEIREAVEAGIGIVGENYVQETKAARAVIGGRIKWHFIGRLQRNKVKEAVTLFDMIETVDSTALAEEIDRRCRALDRVMPVLLEVNSGEEKQKAGVPPGETEELIERIRRLENVSIMGLMTMGPGRENPEELRPYFARTKELFEKIRVKNPTGVTMRYLSMGMSDSYRVAIAEGANVVRIGSLIFGPRSNETQAYGASRASERKSAG